MAEKPEKILIIKLGALGDFIQALGPMAAIRKHHPDATITLLTTKPFQDFAAQCGFVDDVILDVRPGFLNISGWCKLREMLNQGQFTRVYDLQNNDRTSFYFRLMAPKPEWVGAAKGASHCNTSSARTAGHAFDGHVQTLGLAGIKNVEIDRLDWMQADIKEFPLQEPFVLFVPGSAPSHPQKRWPATHYGRLAKMLAGWGFQTVLLGTESEKDLTAEIAHSCPEVLDLTGRTDLFHVAALARGAAGAIGNDTGPMHLIAATGCPSLVLFSAHSNPERHAPKGDAVRVLQKDNLADLSPEEVLKSFAPKQKPAQDSGTKTMH